MLQGERGLDNPDIAWGLRGRGDGGASGEDDGRAGTDRQCSRLLEKCPAIAGNYTVLDIHDHLQGAPGADQNTGLRACGKVLECMFM